MAIIQVTSKFCFVKGIKEVCKISLKEAKNIADEIFGYNSHDTAVFDPKKFGWTIETLKEIITRANSFMKHVKVLSYE